jgi:hypothetical protein
VVARLLDTGTDTGFSAEEDVGGALPVEKLTLTNTGDRRARLRIMLPRTLPSGGGYSARVESDTTRLQVTRERGTTKGTWFEVRNAASGTDGMFRWPAQRAVVVTPPVETRGKFEILDWEVVLADAPRDSWSLARKRGRVDLLLLSLFVLGSLGGGITMLRKGHDASEGAQPATAETDAPTVDTPQSPQTTAAVAAGARVIPTDDINPLLFLELLVTSVHGGTDEEGVMQRFLRLRLGGYDYDSALNSLALDQSPRYRMMAHGAAVIFTRKVDACIEEFTRARQRFP